MKRFLRPFISSWWEQLALDCQAEEGKGRSRVVGLFSRTLLKTGRKGKKKEFRTVAAQCRDRIKKVQFSWNSRDIWKVRRFGIPDHLDSRSLCLTSHNNSRFREKKAFQMENGGVKLSRKEKREKMAENGRGKNSPLAILRIA